ATPLAEFGSSSPASAAALPPPNGLASMDQADLGPDQSLRQACSHHEMVIGQHEQSIRTLLEFNQSLSQVVQLTNQVTELLAASGTSPRPPESRGTDPEPYSGQPHLCRGFLFQCQLVFQQCPTRFNSGAAKIHYLRGLLRGKGLQWAEARLANTPVDNLDGVCHRLQIGVRSPVLSGRRSCPPTFSEPGLQHGRGLHDRVLDARRGGRLDGQCATGCFHAGPERVREGRAGVS
uniref:DUF4939 domain-containing protein n=1 Tax=Periophthalmus magnuspinnatus TaxID=409849 RepID=A0A3B3ZDS5_9GOBI